MAITYSWSSDEEHYQGQFAAREDAAIDGVSEAGLKPGDTVTVGENHPHTAEDMVRSYIDSDHVIEALCACACDNIGEHAEGWPDVSKDDCKKLDEALVKAITPFIDEPRFWSIGGTESIEITVAMFLKAHPPDGLTHCRNCYEWIRIPEHPGACPERDDPGGACEPLTAEAGR